MNRYDILIVEDDPFISELIVVTLSSTFYAITCVDTGTKAFTQLSEHKPDLVLLDILIPNPTAGPSTRPSEKTPNFQIPR